MTKNQALALLDQAVSQMKLSRNEHAALQKALQVLATEGVSNNAQPPPPPKELKSV